MGTNVAGLTYNRTAIGPLKFGDMGGGVVTAYPGHSLRENEVSDALNALFEKRGCTRWPGYAGISTSALFSSPVRGWFVYKKANGSEVYIAVSDRKIYSVDLSAGTKTLLSAISADTDCYGVNYHGKLWIANGTDFVKVENDQSVYRVGIVAPTGFTASATGTGTLPAGAYGVYVSYARKIGSTIVLHSAPTYVNTITVNGSELIRIVATASTDTQVTHIVAWLTNAGGSTYYYYGETANATGNFDISSTTNRNTSLLMYEEASGNQLPSDIVGIYATDGRIFGWKADSNILYYSMKMQNVYDLERWSTEFYIPTIPFVIYSVHGIGGDLIINTAGGMYKIPNCTVSTKPQAATQGNAQVLYFPKNYVKTVQEYNGALWGLTNDGFRIFDGDTFSIDLSKHIKPQIDTIFNNCSNFNPASVIYRRSGKRTEYQLSYNDNTVHIATHNRRIVLNMDRLTITDNENYTAPWEIVSGGFSHAIVTSSNALYVAQSNSNSGVIAREANYADSYCFGETGSFLSTVTAKRFFLRTRTIINELAGVDIWQRVYAISKLEFNCNLKMSIPDLNQYSYSTTIEKTYGSNPPILDGSTPLTFDFILPAENPLTEFNKMPINAKGNVMYLELDQTQNDTQFVLYEMHAYCLHERNAFV